MRRTIFLLMLCFFCLAGLSQPVVPSSPPSTAKINTLITELSKAETNGRKRVDLLNELVDATGKRDLEKAVSYTQEAKALASQIGYKSGLARSTQNLADLRMAEGRQEEAILLFNEAAVIYREEKRMLDAGICYHGLASLYNNMNRNKLATEYFLKALDIFSGLNEYRRAGAVHNNIGRMFQAIGNKEKAIEHYKESLRIAEANRFFDMVVMSQNNISSYYTDRKEFVQAEQTLLRVLKDTASRSFEPQLFHALAITYSKMERVNDALFYFNRILEHPLTRRPSPEEMMAHGNMATLYLQSGQLDKAEEYALKAVTFARSIRQPHIAAFQQIRLADIYAARQKLQEAIVLYEESLPRLNYAQTDPFTVEKMHRNLIDLYGRDNDSAGMLRAHLRLTQFKDSITSADVRKQIASLHIQYETEKKEQQIEILSKDKLLQRALFDQQQLAFLAREKEDDLVLLQTSNELQSAKLNEQAARFAAEQKANDLATLSSQKEIVEKNSIIQQEKLKQHRIISYSFIGLAVLLLALGMVLLSRYRLKQKANIELNRKNEKIELLMHEVHHRVKNNMQLVSSLLSLQSMRMPDSDAKAAVQQGQQRVEAMAMIHRDLYMQDEIASVNVKKYLNDLIQNLVQSNDHTGIRPALKLDIADVILDVDTAVPLGLIANELVTNSLKYGFKNNAGPLLEVSLIQTGAGGLVMTVNDNGPGFIAKDTSNSFGLRMVHALTRQLKGVISTTADRGTQHTLTIPFTHQPGNN